MKKKILAVAAALFALSANAQMWVGGALGFDYSPRSNSHARTTTFTISPSVGYDLNEKWGLGLNLSLSLSDHSNKTITAMGRTDSSGNTHSYSVSPFVRFSFAKSGKATFFVDGAVSFGLFKSHNDYYRESWISSTTTVDNQESTSDGYTLMAGLRPGVKFAVAEHLDLIAMTGFIGWQKNHSNADLHSANNNTASSSLTQEKWAINVDQTLVNLGLIYKF